MKERIVEILEDKKVEDVSIIDVRHRSALFDYFIIGTVESSRQVDAVIDELEKANVPIHHLEGSSDSEWVLIDSYDIVIHLFSARKRAEYDIESLWKDTSNVLSG